MDTNIASELNQLQEKRQAVNIETDLRGHCDALIRMDQKVSVMLEDIRNLHVDLDERFGFVEDVWEQLEQPYKTLKRVDEALDLMIVLHKLSKVCRRIDTSPYLCLTPEGQLVLKRSLHNNDGQDDENIDERDDKMTLEMVQELLDSFESTYNPLENLLSKRLDLPFIAYATKVRNFQMVLATQLKQPKSKSK